MRIPSMILIGAGAIALAGCAYGDYYGGVGLGYGDYGYAYGPYGGYGVYPGYYGGFGYPFGWYDNFYYPGTGIFVYDSYRRPRVWSGRERNYWMRRTTTTTTTTTRPNWSGFNRHRGR